MKRCHISPFEFYVNDKTIVQNAIKDNDIELLKILMKSSFVNQDKFISTINDIIQYSSLEVLKFLFIDEKSNKNLVSNEELFLLLEQAAVHDNLEIFEYLVDQYKTHPDKLKNSENEILLYRLIFLKKNNFAKKLIENGANILLRIKARKLQCIILLNMEI